MTPTPAEVQSCLDAIETETLLGGLVRSALRARAKQAPFHLRLKWWLESRWFLIRKPYRYWRFVHACRRIAGECRWGTRKLQECDGCGRYVPEHRGSSYRDEAWFCEECWR